MGQASARDSLFLAITRAACVYGVPLGGFLLGVGAAALAFDLTMRYGIWWRAAICGGSLAIVLGVMRLLTAWEPKWFEIGVAWLRTRAPVLWSRHTRRNGGTTFSPLPVDLRSNPDLVRDYVG